MKKAIVMAGVLFALTMTAGCGSQNQDHAATAESDVTENEEEALQDNENTENHRRFWLHITQQPEIRKQQLKQLQMQPTENCLSCSRQRHILQKTWIIMIRKAVSAKNMRIRIRSRTG